MACRLIQNIKHTCLYNPGGISEIYLLDIDDFISYTFINDTLYNTCYVDNISKKEKAKFIVLSEVSESNFTESGDSGLYKQQFSSFVGTIEAAKTANLLIASNRKYLVAFRNMQGKVYTFGQDGGASVTFTQITGQIGETAGYQVTITKESVYPLFELNAEKFNTTLLLSTENKRIVLTEDRKCAILI